jgi:hypothetical protein
VFTSGHIRAIYDRLGEFLSLYLRRVGAPEPAVA